MNWNNFLHRLSALRAGFPPTPQAGVADHMATSQGRHIPQHEYAATADGADTLQHFIHSSKILKHATLNDKSMLSNF